MSLHLGAREQPALQASRLPLPSAPRLGAKEAGGGAYMCPPNVAAMSSLAPHQGGVRAKQEGSPSSHGAVPGTAPSSPGHIVCGDAVL